jgi:hypothetical protein
LEWIKTGAVPQLEAQEYHHQLFILGCKHNVSNTRSAELPVIPNDNTWITMQHKHVHTSAILCWLCSVHASRVFVGAALTGKQASLEASKHITHLLVQEDAILVSAWALGSLT